MKPITIFTNAIIAVGVFAFVLGVTCSLCRGRRGRGRGRADAAEHAAAAALALAVRRQQHQQLLLLMHGGARGDGGGRLPCPPTPPAARLPSFKYNRSVKHNVTAGGAISDDADQGTCCSVCLAAFQTGETVRLLPVCLHLYHAGCIDPWLDKHTTCPLCRSATDPATEGGQLPPV
ncbi:hypothetical protein ACP70R_021355 [Stipagrostis hirtigluma subsp. patula]